MPESTTGKVFTAPDWADHGGLVDFYTRERTRPDDLHASERRFLPWLARQAESVVDIGCAAGGFKNIWSFYQPNIAYTGVDVSAPLIDAARRLHPNSEFHLGNCADGLSLRDRHSVIVQALGWIHWEPRYQHAIEELWRLTDRYLFFDARLARDTEQAVTGQQSLSYTGSIEDGTTVPYQVISWPIFAEFLLGLGPASLVASGYWGDPSDTVNGIDGQICLVTFVLEKSLADADPKHPVVCLDMPLDWPDALGGSVQLQPKSRLELLVPSDSENPKS